MSRGSILANVGSPRLEAERANSPMSREAIGSSIPRALGRERALLPIPRQRWRGRHPPVAPLPCTSGAAALVAALELLLQRSSGPDAWVWSFRHDPVAFLLDTAGESIGITVWGGDDQPLYQSRAAERSGVSRARAVHLEHISGGTRFFERRCLSFRCGGRDCVLEIISEPVLAEV